MAEDISIIHAEAWSTKRFSGWAIDIAGYDHTPGVEFGFGNMSVCDFVPLPQEGGTSFLLVNLDVEPAEDGPAALLRAVREIAASNVVPLHG